MFFTPYNQENRSNIAGSARMKNAMFSNSKARSFNLHIMGKSHSVNNGNLFLRCNDICKSHGLPLSRYIFDEHYVKHYKTLLYSKKCDNNNNRVYTPLSERCSQSRVFISQCHMNQTMPCVLATCSMVHVH